MTKLQDLAIQLKKFQDMLDTNANVDWTEHDPADEFKELSKRLGAIIPTDGDNTIAQLGNYISDTDVAKAYRNLVAQSEIDGDVQADEIVLIWKPFAMEGWTVDDLLDRL